MCALLYVEILFMTKMKWDKFSFVNQKVLIDQLVN